MKAVKLYVREAIETGLARNQSDLAEKLGVTRSAVSDWMTGDTAPNEDQAAALAELLGKPEVMAQAMAARAKKPEARAAWERLAAHLHRTATAALSAFVILQLTESVPLSALTGACAAGLCIMLSRLPRQMIMS